MMFSAFRWLWIRGNAPIRTLSGSLGRQARTGAGAWRHAEARVEMAWVMRTCHGAGRFSASRPPGGASRSLEQRTVIVTLGGSKPRAGPAVGQGRRRDAPNVAVATGDVGGGRNVAKGQASRHC